MNDSWSISTPFDQTWLTQGPSPARKGPLCRGGRQHEIVERPLVVARHVLPPYLQEYWASGTAPLLDLQAASDPYRPRSTADELVNEFGRDRVTVVVIPDSSHAVPIEQPAAVADALVAWARTLPAQPAGPTPAP